MNAGIDKLIINGPYQEPTHHWAYDRETRRFKKKKGRRPAGYIKATPRFKGFDDPGVFVGIELVNRIRERVKSWRENGYAGVTSITKRLLEHWHDPEERNQRRFFFCQLEAIETLIWLVEAPASDKVGIDIPGDGGEFIRWCSKMATGSGKTVVMSMIIAWNFLNKAANLTDSRFSKNVLIIAPGLTVKKRLEVLQPSEGQNYYEEFNVVPPALMDKLRQGRVLIHNWHKLSWDSQEKIDAKVEKGRLRSVDKRQRMEISDTAYTREVLEEMANAKNIIVINDEAHHAWRINPEAKGTDKDSAEEATIWLGGLDKIHSNVGILRCFDLSATPLYQSSGKTAEETLFPWIVSDFGLDDAIESGLVKTPRVAARDDSRLTKELRSRLYHIYIDKNVKDDINRKAEASEPLPDLIRQAYVLLGKDWLDTKEAWRQASHEVPPVMITVANRTETSARIKYAFEHDPTGIPELSDSEKILQIDSKVLESAEAEDEEPEVAAGQGSENGGSKPTQKERAKTLRDKVNTVGKKGRLGEKIQNVISVGMLSEGWDANTVTHIMGLRAFTSQLLCEQVVGRGLRRVCYEVNNEGLLDPEYVNIFGVPFTFLRYEENVYNGKGLRPESPKTKIEPVAEKQQHKITWPNVIRIDHVYTPILRLDVDSVKTLEINRHENITEVELEAIVDGRTHPEVQASIDLKKIPKGTRLQTIIFHIAHTIYNSDSRPEWRGSDESFFAQLIGLIERFIESDKIKFTSEPRNEEKRKVLLMLNMKKIIQHIWSAIRSENTQKLAPVFDSEKPVKSTSDAMPWFTKKRCEWKEKSHISHCVYDSTWEATVANFMDKSELVASFVKNDHLGFFVFYTYDGIIRKFFPDFVIRLANGEYLVLEVKGQDNQEHETKREYLSHWVEAINQDGKFGKWHSQVCFDPGEVEEIINQVSEKAD